MFSDGFERLYCDTAVFEPFSTLHPISFARVLPFQPDDPVVDDPGLLGAEAAHLAARNDLTRGEVINAYARYGLLSAEDAGHVKSVIDLYDVDFFDLMGLVYANASMYICALRWYRECIRALEAPRNGPRPELDDNDDIQASIGYCLYALGLYPEAVAWTKSCAGPQLTADANCEALLDDEAQQAGGRLRGVERVIFRARYTLSASDPAQAGQSAPRLKAALKAYVPGQEIHLDWIAADAPLLASLAAAESPVAEGESLFDPVWIVRDNSALPRHKLNLLFASHAWAGALIEEGAIPQARQLLSEAALLDPSAAFIQSRLKTLG
jgi:tetratricopeptide (TPR) repeat protein